MNDLKFAFRQLTKNPGFTAVAVLTLALGIGANTAIFSIVNAVLLKNLPVKSPEQLFALSNVSDGDHISFSFPAYQALRARSQVFESLLAHDRISLNLSARDQVARVSGEVVSANFFSVLGVSPHFGRFFSDESDQTPGVPAEVVLSHSFWMLRFGGDPNLVGKAILLNGYPFTVAGIAPPGFFGVEVGAAPELWIPMTMLAQTSDGRDRLTKWNNFGVNVMGRIKPGVGQQEAQAATGVLFHQIYQDAPGIRPGLRSTVSKWHLQLQPASKGLSNLRNRFGRPLLILMGAVGLVLLIACGNVASLLIARAIARRAETSIRVALGASRRRLLRQWLTEGALLSLLGCLLGLLFSFWTSGMLLGFLLDGGFALKLHPDFQSLGFTTGISALTCMLFGLVPAFQAARPNLANEPKNEISARAGGGRFGVRNILVVAQVTLTVVVLIGAGLFVRTVQSLRSVDLGFRADKVLLLTMSPSGYTSNQVANLYGQLLERVEALPGVQSASLASYPLLAGQWIDGLSVQGLDPAGRDMTTTAKQVAPNFFKTMGIPLIMGRDFVSTDGPKSKKVAVVNQTLARGFFGQENPLGKRIGLGDTPDCEIIGVIQDTKYHDLKEKPVRTVYVPIAQSDSAPSTERTLHVRTAGDPRALIDAISREIQALDKDLPVSNVRTFTELVASTILQERFVAMLSSVFGLLALVLVSVGLYGILACNVAQRRREIGIRMALGARRRDVLGMILSQGMILVSLGMAIGLAAALGLTRVLNTLIYGVGPTDPVTFASIPALLAIVALLACWLPARRAARVDPMEALRYE